MSTRHPISQEDTDFQTGDSLWVQVATGNPDDLLSLALVLASVGVEHRMVLPLGELQVREEDAATAFDQLAEYQKENLNWPEPQAPSLPHGIHMDPVTLPLMILLCVFFLHTGQWTQHNSWFLQGAVNRAAIMEHGQWWRLITALTLHADLVHLSGNVLIGGYLMHELSRFLGSGTTWGLAIVSGGLANWVNIVFRNEQHLSVGFSTIVFSCIGLFVGLQLFRGSKILTSLLIPLGAGISLLALLGSGGERTDLGAHLFGLCAGISIGLLSRVLSLEQHAGNVRVQTLCFLSAAALVTVSWLCALNLYV